MATKHGKVKGRLAATALVAAVAAGSGWGIATVRAEDCVRVPVVATTFDDAVVCAGEGDSADGTVAISLRGPARASGPLAAAAVSGTSTADGSNVCASGTGRAGDFHDSGRSCAVSVSAAGADEDERPAAGGIIVALSGRGAAQAPVAVSLFGDSRAQLVSVSGTGEADGQTYTGRHESPFVAVSGCRAQHAGHDEPDNVQVLTADPSRVHILVDAEVLFNPSKPVDDWEPTDIETGAVGAAVQSVTCEIRP